MIFYLALGGMLFFIGLFGVLTRRRVVSVLLALELMFAGAVLNVVVFNRYITGSDTNGYQMAFFIALIALLYALVAIICLRLRTRRREPIPDDQVRLFQW